MAVKKNFIADSVDEAITAAALGLGIPSDRIAYEVVNEGSKGFLGLIGKKQAEIIAWDKTEEPEQKPEKKESAPAPEKKEEAAKPAAKEEKKEAPVKAASANNAQGKAQGKEAAPKKEEAKKEEAKKAEPKKEEVKKEETKKTEIKAADEKEKVKTTVNDPRHFEDGKAFLMDVFDKMGMKVQIDYKYDEEDNALEMNLSGDEMGVLIGKRGQTLDSLQYLTSLVVNRSGEHYIRVKLDTENYRERRKETLESLAKNIAYKVKRTRRSVSLEPMNPYERRIIHSALQQDNFVMTKSEGEEPYRHVVVFYRRNRNGEER